MTNELFMVPSSRLLKSSKTSVCLHFCKHLIMFYVSSHKKPRRPQGHNIRRRHSFLPLNGGGLADFKMRRCCCITYAVCFNGGERKKNVQFVFGECLGFAVIVFYPRRCSRDALAARRTMAQGYQLCRFCSSYNDPDPPPPPSPSQGGGAAAEHCFACRNTEVVDSFSIRWVCESFCSRC